VRSIDYNPFEKKRLIDRLRLTVERLQLLEREALKLDMVVVEPTLRVTYLFSTTFGKYTCNYLCFL
jgi:hypothetical protein